MLKHRDMARSRWPRVTEKSYRYMDVDDGFYRGVAGLIVLQTVAEPFVKRYADGRELRLIDEGFHWLQLAPEGENWWLTAMFDEKKRLVQFYFDITEENHLLPEGGSWMEDLYLDLVVYPDGEAIVLDRDELDEALAAGEISAAQHEKALRVCEDLLARFAGNTAELTRECERLLARLLCL